MTELFLFAHVYYLLGMLLVYQIKKRAASPNKLADVHVIDLILWEKSHSDKVAKIGFTQPLVFTATAILFFLLVIVADGPHITGMDEQAEELGTYLLCCTVFFLQHFAYHSRYNCKWIITIIHNANVQADCLLRVYLVQLFSFKNIRVHLHNLLCDVVSIMQDRDDIK
ncbi:hypothetical protein ACJX0J_030338, partial [Zea mays]